MNNPVRKTLVIGGSENPRRYSYLAIKKLREHGNDVVSIGGRNGQVDDVGIMTEKRPFQEIDTVTFYLNPTLQKSYYDYILSLHPRRIIFNPGAENPEFYRLAESAGIEPIEACTLVLLSTGQY
jgi:hypothetical protein